MVRVFQARCLCLLRDVELAVGLWSLVFSKQTGPPWGDREVIIISGLELELAGRSDVNCTEVQTFRFQR